MFVRNPRLPCCIGDGDWWGSEISDLWVPGLVRGRDLDSVVVEEHDHGHAEDLGWELDPEFVEDGVHLIGGWV